jgi:acyl carrier protein
MQVSYCSYPVLTWTLRRQITETAHFANDLGLDSLDTVEVVMAIEEVRDT